MTKNLIEIEKEIKQAHADVITYGDNVRALKAKSKEGNISKAEIEEAIQQLQEKKNVLIGKEQLYEEISGIPRNPEVYRQQLTAVLESKGFYTPSFRIYNAVSGFYDFGPMGCALKQNIIQLWRKHFILEESMLEVECPVVTPHAVLKASGHVDRFLDYMCADMQTGDCHRADHLLEDHLEIIINDQTKPLQPDQLEQARELLARIGELGQQDLESGIKQYGIKAPSTNNELSAPFPFNLMFRTNIGPKGGMEAFLRPETAQGIFTNFKELLNFNHGKLPFAAAQIGNSYRNEISPKQGLLRVREFTQAEIEHFVNPTDKKHPKFSEVANIEPQLYSRELQLGKEKKEKVMRIGEAVSKGIIGNETLAYFIGRTQLFLQKLHLNMDRVRFRQHLQHEMAHYAEDCWDAEIHTSYGWVEIAGLADRSAYDLSAHSQHGNSQLTAYESFAQPKIVKILQVKPQLKELGSTFKKQSKIIADFLSKLPEHEAKIYQKKLQDGQKLQITVENQHFEINSSMVKIYEEDIKLSGKNFVPSVIEPSFGIGRIMYCVLEHSFYSRAEIESALVNEHAASSTDKKAAEAEKRTVFRFSPLIAPKKVSVFPLVQKSNMNTIAQDIYRLLLTNEVESILDVTGTTIGKRYARTDEIGIPYAVTIDGQTLEDQTVTLRDRDSMKQVRIPKDKLQLVIKQLTQLQTQWQQIILQYPEQIAQAKES